MQPSPSQSSERVDRARVEAEVAKRRLVLRLAEDGNVVRQKPLGGVVEMVLVTMCHEHPVEPPNDLLGGERQLHGRVGPGFAVLSIGGRAPAGSSIGSTRIRRPLTSRTTVALRISVMRMPYF